MNIFRSHLIPLMMIIPILSTFGYTAVTIYNQEYRNQESITIDTLHCLLDGEGKPSNNLKRLLELFSIQHDNTLKTIVEKTQQVFMCQPGKEGFQIGDSFKEQTDEALSLFYGIGLLQEIRPHYKQYDYALLLGTALPEVRMRLAYLIDLFNKGIRFKAIVLLAGARSLDPRLESELELLNPSQSLLPLKQYWHLTGELPKTESDMMKMVFDQAALPEEMQSIPCIFIDTPMHSNSDGDLYPPSTEDIVAQWLSQNPIPGTCLVISNQPYVGCQDAIIKRILPKTFSIDTVGKKATEMNMTIFLDTIARWLYQEYRYANTI
jgi:hypothetical protein